MDTKQISDEKGRLFYRRWNDFLQKARAAAEEVLQLETIPVEHLVLSISHEVWEALNYDLAELDGPFPKRNLNIAKVEGIGLRKVHMEVTNQILIQDKGLVLVARLFAIPSDIDEWGRKGKLN